MKEIITSVLQVKQYFAFLLIFILTGNSTIDLFSQNVVKPTRQSSIEVFSNGKYEEAYLQFSQLLKLYPRDPLYKYYSGVCLIQLKKDPESAADLLQEALKGAALRALPSDALFYLGRAQQMSGRFNEAVDAYEKFEDQSGKKIAKEMGVAGLIRQCLDKQGQLIEEEPESVIAKNVEQAPVSNTVMVQSAANAGNVKPVIEKSVVPAKESLPSDYEKLLGEAMKLQYKADSLREVASWKKQKIGGVPANSKETEKKKISEIDLLAANYQKKADQKFNEATILKSGGSLSEIKQDPAPVVKQVQPQKGIFSVFEILQKPVFTPADKIAVNADVPEGLVYRIQMAVFRNPVSPSVFKGITPLYGFKITSNGLTHYYAGMFRKTSDASKALAAVKAKGFKDSFIVAFSGSKPVSAERAAVMEKEWGNVSLFKEVANSPKTAADTLPPTLTFRVEVSRIKKPFDEKKTEELRKVAGSRGLDVQKAEDGNTVYLIGKFITFESAAEYNDILVRNGYSESKVIAWLGNKEIPVETARKLFEKIE